MYSTVAGLKLQFFGHLMQRVDSLEKTLMLGGTGAGGEGDPEGNTEGPGTASSEPLLPS